MSNLVKKVIFGTVYDNVNSEVQPKQITVMKKFALMALSLIIVMMCVSPTEVMGQSRRTANTASTSSTSVQKSSPTRSGAATNNAAATSSRRSGSSSNVNTATRSTASASSRSTNISRETASHSSAARTNNNTNATRNINNGANRNAGAATVAKNTENRSTAAATRNVTNNNANRSNNTATRNVAANSSRRTDNARNVASNTARHDNVAPKEGTRTSAPKVNEGGRAAAPKVNDNPPAVRNEAPRAEERMHSNPPRPHDNPPRMHNEPRPPRHPGHNPPPPPRPRPPRGSHFRASVIGAMITIAKINLIHDAIRRAERAARLATRYSVVINRSYVPRTYATIVETVRDDINYYYHDGVFYIIGADGDYYVIEPPIGALVEAIPADYERLVIDDEVFYKVDDTLYKVVIVDGNPFFEVVLNL